MSAQRIRNRRNELGLSQDQLAARARISKRTVMRVEAGEGCHETTLRALSRALGIDEDELVAGMRPDPGTEAEDLAVTVIGSHPRAAEFVALAAPSGPFFVAFPDVRAFRLHGRPGLRDFLSRIDPRKVVESLGYADRDPPFAILFTASACILSVCLFAHLGLAGHRLAALVVGVAATAGAFAAWNAVEVVAERFRHAQTLRELEDTAYVFQVGKVEVVTLFRDGARCLETSLLGKRYFRKSRCGEAWTYRVYGIDLHALPDDAAIDRMLRRDKPFRGGRLMRFQPAQDNTGVA